MATPGEAQAGAAQGEIMNAAQAFKDKIAADAGGGKRGELNVLNQKEEGGLTRFQMKKEAKRCEFCSLFSGFCSLSVSFSPVFAPPFSLLTFLGSQVDVPAVDRGGAGAAEGHEKERRDALLPGGHGVPRRTQVEEGLLGPLGA